MKKMLAIACLIAECDYGMEVPREADITEAVPREAIRNTEQSSVGSDITEAVPWEAIQNTEQSSVPETDYTALEITETTLRHTDLSLSETDISLREACEQWRIETIMRRFSLPILITSATFPILLNFTSEMIKRKPKSVYRVLKCCASISEIISLAILSFLLWCEASYFYYNIWPRLRNHLANREHDEIV
ncbi:MAG: hypothetical protein J6T91_02995 [Alphaproteobacteria bacterium]|nr:hypothetical protein [Alphaproteobacteria bacterium]